ncbi:MAG: flavodoxin-dependent (E)-4-hydroxy-3-methylbut-2-enyl-diphosphate synthase [Acidobacteriota bacterium]
MNSRRKSTVVKVGNVLIGGCKPIVVQSMTDTTTADVDATVAQILELADAGSELVRITVNNEAAAEAVPHIVDRLRKESREIPVIGDFHYNGHLILERSPDCARALAKYRINPGNVGMGNRHDEHFARIIKIAVRHEKPVRIGVNWGSLDQHLLADLMEGNARRPYPLTSAMVLQDAMVKSALNSAAAAENEGLPHDHIVISAKVSEVPALISIYRELSQKCDYPLHLGLTEAGIGSRGIVASASALAVLLNEGIGDTIRVSITPEPRASRTEEVVIARQVLQSLGLRIFSPQVTSCPGCGRTNSTLFQELAREIQDYLDIAGREWKKKYPGSERLKVAVMGCVVNGPGESKHAEIGIS